MFQYPFGHSEYYLWFLENFSFFLFFFFIWGLNQVDARIDLSEYVLFIGHLLAMHGYVLHVSFSNSSPVQSVQ